MFNSVSNEPSGEHLLAPKTASLKANVRFRIIFGFYVIKRKTTRRHYFSNRKRPHRIVWGKNLWSRPWCDLQSEAVHESLFVDSGIGFWDNFDKTEDTSIFSNTFRNNAPTFLSGNNCRSSLWWCVHEPLRGKVHRYRCPEASIGQSLREK